MFLPVLFTDFIDVADDVLHELLTVGLVDLLVGNLLGDNLLARPLSLKSS